MYELQIVKSNTGNKDRKDKKTNDYYITKFKHVVPLVRDIIDHQQEHAIVISMNADRNVLKTRVVHIGTGTQCTISYKDIFRGPIEDNADCMIFVHNHPKEGFLDPSKDDKKTTKAIVKIGRYLGINVVDSIIISQYGAYSMAKKKTISIKKGDVY